MQAGKGPSMFLVGEEKPSLSVLTFAGTIVTAKFKKLARKGQPQLLEVPDGVMSRN